MTTNIYDMADTWNNGATVFTAIKMNVTDTASDSGSFLINLQVSSTSKFSVNKFGGMTAKDSSIIEGNLTLFSNSAEIRFGTLSDLRIMRDAANVLGQREGTNAQTLRVYRTFTDASNYERLALQSGSGYFEIAAETAGTGTDNIDLRITPAGTGVIDVRNVQVSTTSSNTATLTNAIASAAPALWINVKATGGNYVMPLWATI